MRPLRTEKSFAIRDRFLGNAEDEGIVTQQCAAGLCAEGRRGSGHDGYYVESAFRLVFVLSDGMREGFKSGFLVELRDTFAHEVQCTGLFYDRHLRCLVSRSSLAELTFAISIKQCA